MSDDYGYINARIRAMKSFLLKEGDYLGALRQRTGNDLVAYLSGLPAYAQDLRQSLTEYPLGSVCEQALKQNLSRTFKKIIRFCDGEPKRLVLILLMPWDIHNLKTIIRGILTFQDQDKIIQALIISGKWDLEMLKRLATSQDLKALANNLMLLAEDEEELEIAGLIRDYSLDTPLELLENSLEGIYFKKSQGYLSRRDANCKIVLEYLSLEIDFLNILSLLKKINQIEAPLHPKNLNPEEGVTGFSYVAGGRLTEKFFKDLDSLKSIEEALKIFKESDYPWLGEEGLILYQRTKRLSSLERLLENKLLSFCSNLYIKADPLSISIPLAFINFKKTEIRNLRFINQAVIFGMPEDLVREELNFAG